MRLFNHNRLSFALDPTADTGSKYNRSLDRYCQHAKDTAVIQCLIVIYLGVAQCLDCSLHDLATLLEMHWHSNYLSMSNSVRCRMTE